MHDRLEQAVWVDVRRFLEDPGRLVRAFITARPAASRHGPGLGFIGELHRAAEETTMKLLSLEPQRCPTAVAVALGLAEDDGALHVVRTRSRGRAVARPHAGDGA